MYIESVPNRHSPPAILLRESYREGGRVKKRTLLNLSDWPADRIAGFKMLLKGGTVVPSDQQAITIIRSLPHGHVVAALGTARKIGLDRLLGPDGNRCRDLVLALVVSRLLDPGSKLAAARALSPDTASSSLGQQLGLGPVDEDELYIALDWLAVRQPAIETTLAKDHLAGGTLVLYDVSSSYMEGRCCPLAQYGYNRDGKRGKLQIVYGLLCAADGCPVAIEVFDGSTADPVTLTSQVTKLKERFGLDHVVLVGDRGMITQARIAEDLSTAGLDWITALRAPAIKILRDAGALQMSLFDERDMAAITSPDFPGERLIVCRNQALAAERARRREDLLAATGARTGAHRRGSGPPAPAAARRGRHRSQSRGGARPAQNGQALHSRHCRQPLWLFPQDRGHRRRGGPRRHLCRAHQPARHGTRRPHHGAQLQVPEPGRARLPLPQERRSADPAGLPLAGRPGARPRVFVHAGLLSGMAHASASSADALPRHRQGRRRSTARQRRCQGRALARRHHQTDHRADRGWATGSQLPHATGRPCHADPQHPGDCYRSRALVHPVGSAYRSPTEGARSPRPPPYPVMPVARHYLFSEISGLHDHKSSKLRLTRGPRFCTSPGANATKPLLKRRVQ